MLDGGPTLRPPEGKDLLDPWDAVCFPAGPGGAHAVANDTDLTVRVLMFSTRNDPAASVYPDSGKIGIWTGNADAEDVPEVERRRLLGRRDRVTPNERARPSGTRLPVSAWPIDQRVHVVRALVGDDRLEVVHVPDHRVLERDAVGAEHLRAVAGDLERGVDVAELAHADLLGPQRARVLHPAEVQREQRRPVHLERHLGELLLRSWNAAIGRSNCIALLRVVERRLEAGARGADRAQDDPVARLVQAGQRPAQRRTSGSTRRPAAARRRAPAPT